MTAATHLAVRARYPGVVIVFRGADGYTAFLDSAEALRGRTGVLVSERFDGTKVSDVATFANDVAERVISDVIASGRKVAVVEPDREKE